MGAAAIRQMKNIVGLQMILHSSVSRQLPLEQVVLNVLNPLQLSVWLPFVTSATCISAGEYSVNIVGLRDCWYMSSFVYKTHAPA